MFFFSASCFLFLFLSVIITFLKASQVSGMVLGFKDICEEGMVPVFQSPGTLIMESHVSQVLVAEDLCSPKRCVFELPVDYFPGLLEVPQVCRR